MATDKLSGKLPQYLIKWYFMGNGLGYGYQGCIMQCSLTVQYVSVWDGKDGILAVKNVFEVGSPGPAVLAVAKKFNADLIVMGSRGLGPLKGLFMGSVSSYVTSHSTCPVLVVK